MAKQLKKIFAAGTDEVVQDFTINSWHVSQSVDALTAAEAYDISISGSLNVTGSVNIKELDTDAALTNFVVIDTSTGTLKKRTGGSAGTNGSSGTSGSSGSSGTSGSSGSSGTSGTSVVGPTGNSGSSGSSGTSGTSAGDITGLDTQVLYFDGDDNPAGDSELTWDDVNKTLRISSADNGTSGKSNLILTNDVANPTLSTINLGNIVGKMPDDATGIEHAKIQFEPDNADWVYASGEWKIAPSAITFWTNTTNFSTLKMKIGYNGQIQLAEYGNSGNFVSSSPTYNLGVDTTGNIVEVSTNYSGSNYQVNTVDRIDYNSYTNEDLTGAASYQFVVDGTVGFNTAVPDTNKILIQTTTKSSSTRIKINIGSFTEEMNIMTPVSQSRLLIGNTNAGVGNDWAVYEVTQVSLLNDATKGDYLDLYLEYISEVGGTTFTAGTGLEVLQFRPTNTTSTTTIYPISDYYTRITFGNLSDDAIDTLFGFWLDEGFRANTLKTGDELIVEAKWFSDGVFGESGGTINFITFATQDGSTLRRRFLSRDNGNGSEVFQVGNSTDANYGKTQIFKFQYWERSSTEYGLIPLSAYDSYQQPSVLN